MKAWCAKVLSLREDSSKARRKYLLLATNSGFYQNEINDTRLNVSCPIPLSIYAKVARAFCVKKKLN